MARIAPVNARGTRDFLPRDLVRRNRVFALLRETFERYGYEPLETPAIENTAVLEGKYGEEGERLLFRILKRGRELESGGRTIGDPAESLQEAVKAAFNEQDTVKRLFEIEEAVRHFDDAKFDISSLALSRLFSNEALRYDLTVPLARVIAAHQNALVFPFRRYQMQPVWRADRPQRGRYREFYQCDVDCVGSGAMSVDAEMVAIHCEVFTKLGFTSFVTKINHRGLLRALMEACDIPEEQRAAALTAVDKLDKVGLDGVREALAKAEIADAAARKLLEMIAVSGAPDQTIARLRPLVGERPDGQRALDELGAVFRALAQMGVPAERVTLDVSLVRGLGYYTGPIFETVLTSSTLGSLGGGGRYDQLIGMFTGRELPCTGISFGIERIFDALDEQGIAPGEAVTTTQALVPLFAPETMAAAFALAGELRAAGINTEVYPEPRDLKAQLSFANKKGIPLAALLGPDELAAGAVVIRDLRAGTQRAVPRGEAVAAARALLGME